MGRLKKVSNRLVYRSVKIDPNAQKNSVDTTQHFRLGKKERLVLGQLDKHLPKETLFLMPLTLVSFKCIKGIDVKSKILRSAEEGIPLVVQW